MITYPVLWRSRRLGKMDLMYAQEQISSRITVSRLWKLKRADCNDDSC